MSETKDYPPYLDYPKPHRKQTNADKIRHMTDEELAAQLKDHPMLRYCVAPDDEYCEIAQDGLNPGFCDDDCYECLLKWLKQEENDNDQG